jgi:ribonucleotide reductase alpha subunit
MIALLVIAILFVFVQNVSAQSLPPNSPVILERNVANCSMAQVTSCSVDDPTIEVLVYGNGVRIGVCSSGSSSNEFYSRSPLSDTITLINTSYTTGTSLSSLSVGCASAQASGELPYPTPTPIPLMTPPPTPEIEFTSQGVNASQLLPAWTFGGSLNDQASAINTWLGYAEDTVDLVNQGNLLYITGAIMSAGMILVWAINTLKNPKD